jgi:hypothetical protein
MLPALHIADRVNPTCGRFAALLNHPNSTLLLYYENYNDKNKNATVAFR